MENLLDVISQNNDCDKKGAQALLDDELNVCRDLLENGDLDINDLDDVCFNLGVDLDHVEDLIEMLAF